MKPRTAIAVVLLVFAAGSLAWLTVREFRDSRAMRNAGGAPTKPTAGTAAAGSATVTVYYFHREQRCPPCEKMEAYTTEAVQKGFAAELESGRIIFRSENWEAPQNAELQKIHDFYVPTVLILDERGKFRKIEYTPWLLDDKAGFIKRVRDEIAAALQ